MSHFYVKSTKASGRNSCLLLKKLVLFSAFAFFMSPAGQAATIGWNFTDLNGIFDSGTPLNFTLSDITVGNTLGGSVSSPGPYNATSASSGYTGASAGGNVGNAVGIGALNTATSAYYTVTFTPSAGFTLELTDFDFGMRSTSSGPTTFALYTSQDNYASAIFTGTTAVTGTWAFKNNTFSAFDTTTAGGAITFRLYTYGGAGAPGNGTENNRMDDISITISAIGTAAPVSTYWDTNGATAGTGNISGNWSGTNWSTDSAGGTATTAFVGGTTAVFAAGTNGTGTYSAHVDTAVNAKGITVEEGNVTIDHAAGGSLTLTDPSVTVASGASATVSETITSSLGLNKLGTGTLTLLGNQTYTGGTSITQGTLQLGDGAGTDGSIAGNVDNSGVLIFANTNAQTYAGNISGTGSVTKNGAGTLIFTGTNGYAGATTVNAGKLQLGDGTTKVGAVTGNIVDNTEVIFANPTDQSYSGAISGSGKITKNSTGALTLGGASSYTGGTTISNGSVTAANNTALGSSDPGFGLVTVNKGALYTASNITLGNDILVSGSPVVAPTLLSYFNFNNATAGVSGGLGTFNTTGTTEVYTPGSPNGTLGPASLGVNAASSTVNLSHLAGAMGGTANNNWGTFAGISLNSAGSPAGQALAVVGTANNGSTVVFNVATTGFSNLLLTYDSRATSSGFTTEAWSYSLDGTTFTPYVTLTGLNTGAWSTQRVDFSSIAALNNASNVYLQLTLTGASATTGNVRIDNVQLNANAAGAPLVPADVVLGTSDINGAASGQFNGNVKLQSAVILTAGSGGSAYFNGVIQDDTTIVSGGVPSVTVRGGGAVILTGDNTYSGGTTVQSGTLLANNSSGSATGSGSVLVNSGATLAGQGGTIGGNTTIAAGGTLAVGDPTTALPDSIPLTLTFQHSLTNNGSLVLDLFTENAGGSGTAEMLIFSSTSGADQINLTGTLKITNLTGNGTTTTAPGFVSGDIWQLIDWSSLTGAGGTYSVAFGTQNLPTLDSSLVWELQKDDTGLYLAVVPVPEPTRSLFMGAGLLALFLRRSRRTS